MKIFNTFDVFHISEFIMKSTLTFLTSQLFAVFFFLFITAGNWNVAIAQTSVEVVTNPGPDQNYVMRNNEKSMALGTAGKQYLLTFYCSTSTIDGEQRIYESLDNGATWTLKTLLPNYASAGINYNRFGSMVMASDQITLHATWGGINWGSTACAGGYQPWSILYASYNTVTDTWSTVEQLFVGTSTTRFMNLPDIDLYTRGGNELPVICYYGKNTSWTSYMNFKIDPTTWAYPTHPGNPLSSSDFFCAPSVLIDANNDFFFTARVRATQCASWKNHMYWRWWDESTAAWGNADALVHPYTANMQSSVFDDADNLYVAVVSERDGGCGVNNGLYVAVKNSGSPVWTSYAVDPAGGGYANGTGSYNFGISNVNGLITVVWADNGAYPTIYKAEWNGAGFNPKQIIVNPGGEAYRFINTYKQENNAYNCLLFDYADQTSDPMDIWVYNCSPPLPIELLSFSCENIESTVSLRWATATETNNDYFTVERSSNGIYFEQTGKVQGAGNSTTTLQYEFIDNSPLEGLNYYRLKQIDYDGTSEFSSVISVIYTKSKKPGITAVYPIPAEDYLFVELNSVADNEVPIEIFDITGRPVLSQNAAVGSGTQSINLDISQLAKGVYSISILNNIEAVSVSMFIKK